MRDILVIGLQNDANVVELFQVVQQLCVNMYIQIFIADFMLLE